MSAEQARNWQQSWQETQTTPNKKTEPKRKVKVKVVKKSWITVGEKFLYSAFGTGLIVAIYFSVSFSSSADALNREVQQLERQITQQEQMNANLEYKVKEYSNPDRIIRIAKENGLKIQNAQVKQAEGIIE